MFTTADEACEQQQQQQQQETTTLEVRPELLAATEKCSQVIVRVALILFGSI